MELHFLGTVAGMPTKERNVSSLVLDLMEERGSLWMFDCGEGTQHQLLKTAIKLRRVNKLFVTHLHGDHIYGIPGMLSSRSYQEGESTLQIFGPPGIREYIDTVLRLSQTRLNFDLDIHEIDEGTVFEDERFRVTAGKLEHRVESFGYRVEEKDRPGRLKHLELKALGVPPGPIYAKIKQGEDLDLNDGTVLHAADFLEPSIPGRVIAIMGDTRICDNENGLVCNADVLVHEATFTADRSDLAHQYFHATAEQAAMLAARNGVNRLILTHISSRYQGEGVEQMLKEARSIHANTDVAADLWSVDVPVKRQQ